MPAPLRLYNTRTRDTEAFEPETPGHVRMYVCGMTVYDYCHIGHARAMITFDVVARWLRARGWQVSYVRNHTDVDDKIIARALENGEDPLALAQRFIDALTEDLGRLGLRPPDHEPRVSTHIDGIVEMIGTLIEKGHAYALEGDVYFKIKRPRHNLDRLRTQFKLVESIEDQFSAMQALVR
jgi:cysteinyl-tRNA synthetase